MSPHAVYFGGAPANELGAHRQVQPGESIFDVFFSDSSNVQNQNPDMT